MSDEQRAFLNAIHANPDDDLVRLVYADWLDEHDRPERAEFIRVQIELAHGALAAHKFLAGKAAGRYTPWPTCWGCERLGRTDFVDKFQSAWPPLCTGGEKLLDSLGAPGENFTISLHDVPHRPNPSI